jgi:cytochrome oxidase assembly protein ShyY1
MDIWDTTSLLPLNETRGPFLSPFPGNSECRPPVLVNRGWIDQDHALRSTRPKSLDPGTTIIRGLGLWQISCQKEADVKVRSPPDKHWFLPKNDFEHGKFSYIDVPEMAAYTGSQSLLVEQTFGPYRQTQLNPCPEADECRWRSARGNATDPERGADWSLSRNNPPKCPFSIYRNMVCMPLR